MHTASQRPVVRIQSRRWWRCTTSVKSFSTTYTLAEKYCPVVLLRNLSDKLVNGLIGKVVSCGDDGPVVNFPSIDVTTKLDKINFSGNYLQFISICIILKGL